MQDDRGHPAPLLHSPPSSDCAKSVDDHLTLHHRPHSVLLASSTSNRSPFPPPPQPLDFETQPRPTRPPLPVPPARPQRPSLPAVPLAVKAKGKPVVMSAEKQAYARALGLDPLIEESDGPTSPTSPPCYVQDREADAREGLSKNGVARHEDAPGDEKGAAEVARVAEALEQEAERKLEADSLSEKARMAREEAEAQEEERLRQEAVEAAVLAKEAAQLDLGAEPRDPLPSLPPSALSTHDDPLDLKEDQSPSSSPVDEVPSYDASAEPPRPSLPAFDTRSDLDQHSAHYSRPDSRLPPPPLRQHYDSQSPSILGPPLQPSRVLYSAPAAPEPTSYTSGGPDLDDFGAGRPPLARQMSLQPAASRRVYSSMTWDGSNMSGWNVASDSTGSQGGRAGGQRVLTSPSSGFYSSGIGSAMNDHAPQVFASGSDRSSSPRAPSVRGDESSLRQSQRLAGSHGSPDAHPQGSVGGLLPPSAFARSESLSYRPQVAPAPSHQHFRQASMSRPLSPPGAQLGHDQTFPVPPVLSPLSSPAGYYSLSPDLPPIPFYTSPPVRPLHSPQHGYFPAPQSSQPPPMQPGQTGVPYAIAHSNHSQQQYLPSMGSSLPPVASPPPVRPASLAPSSIRGRSAGTLRNFFGRKGKKDDDGMSEEADRSSVFSWK